MKKQLYSLLLSLSLVVVLFSCNKDDDPAPTPKTKTQLITQATWKFSAATINGSDASGLLQTCQKDNTMIFVSNGTGTVDEGATKCNAGDPQTNPFTWSFQTNETQLFVSATLFTGGSSTFTLVTLTETQLILSQVISGQTVVVTFIH